MREGITVEVSAVDRARLKAIVADRNSPQKHVWRAEIVLLTADGYGTKEIMRRTGQGQDSRLALAGALHAGRGERPAAGRECQKPGAGCLPISGWSAPAPSS